MTAYCLPSQTRRLPILNQPASNPPGLSMTELNTLTFRLNGLTITTPDNWTIFEAAQKNGFALPRLCDDRTRESGVFCHLCLVEIVGREELVLACRTKVEAGQEIMTFSRRVRRARQEVLWQILNDHPSNCLFCERSGGCKLKEYCTLYGVSQNDTSFRKRVTFTLVAAPDENLSPKSSTEPIWARKPLKLL